MKAKLYLSWVALAVGVFYGVSLSRSGQTPMNPLVAALWWGYVSWALYWGVPVVWRWWRSFSATRRNRDSTLLGQALWFLLGLLVSLFGGYFYGVFGGAIYQCVRIWWKTRAPRRQE